MAMDQSEKVWWKDGGFWSKPSVKVEIKPTLEVVSTCEIQWSARLNTSKVTENQLEDYSSQWEATKRSVKLSTAKGGRRSQRPVSTTVNGDCSTPYLRQRMAYDSGQHRSKPWSTSQHLDDGRSRLKTEVYYEVVSTLSCLHSLACKA